ncbi:asparaginase [Nocardioides caldifontis]|uniref:asparaginase n=1 Tax=Nocardioides caldifontis TaxID=2588938 RepID=UPI0011DFDFF1|nr:asparaginase [Nocardioides caldifontis]
MTQSRVAIGSLGGTITMTSESEAGVTPTLEAADLVAAVPALATVASLEAKTLAVLPSASLRPEDCLAALAWARAAVDGGAAGVVLVQGTDTLEETAYLFDLYWDRDEPLVVTGAMRAPQRPGSDGPANLLAAVVTAAAPESRGLGVLVVMNDEVHAAARVVKADSMAVDAFRSPVFGVLGRLVEGVPVFGNRPARVPALDDPAGASPRVALLATHLDDDGELLRQAVAAGYDGVVIAALGVGHVPAALAEEIAAAASKVPVVFATRTGAGTTARSTYGFVGSESDLLARGAIAAGWLTPVKARQLLWALLAQGLGPEDVARQFAARGGAVA